MSDDDKAAPEETDGDGATDADAAADDDRGTAASDDDAAKAASDSDEAATPGDGDEAAKKKSGRSRRRRRPAEDATSAKKDDDGEDEGTELGSDAADDDPPKATKALAKRKGDKDATGADDDRMDLPKWNRARVKRKQPKGEEADAFQKSVRKAGKAAISRAPVVIGLIVLVAAGISGIVFYLDSREEDRAVATRILAQAVGFQARAQVVDVAQYTKDRKHPFPIPLVNTEEERDTKVTQSLEELTEADADGPAAVTADLVGAARLVRQGKFADAQAAYQGFIEAHPDHEFLFLAREGLAFVHESLGNQDAALAELETLMGNKGDFYRDQAMWHRARILEGQGNADDALALYKQYAEEYPLEESSVARDKVIGRLSELAPELVPAPPEGQAAGPGGPLGGLGIGP